MQATITVDPDEFEDDELSTELENRNYLVIPPSDLSALIHILNSGCANSIAQKTADLIYESTGKTYVIR